MRKTDGGKFSLRKILIYFLFGIGSILIGLLVLPLAKLFIRNEEKFRKYGRSVISKSHKLILWICRRMGALYIETPVPDFSDTGGKILAPNHPSLLDAVVLFSLIPNANCIVRGGLLRSPVGAIVRALYTTNNEDIEDLKHECAKSLARNETLIIFPEGTRTKKGEPVTIKRGAAYIALFANAPVIPLYIGGNDKAGLRKGDPFWMINEAGHYVYRLTRDAEIRPDDFPGATPREKSVALTAHLEELYRSHVKIF